MEKYNQLIAKLESLKFSAHEIEVFTEHSELWIKKYRSRLRSVDKIMQKAFFNTTRHMKTIQKASDEKKRLEQVVERFKTEYLNIKLSDLKSRNSWLERSVKEFNNHGFFTLQQLIGETYKSLNKKGISFAYVNNIKIALEKYGIVIPSNQ